MPVSAHEADMEREDRKHKRNFIIILVLIVALVGSNGAWIYYESQFTDDETTVTQDVDTGDGNAIVTGVGDIYGTSETDGNN